MAVGTLLVAAAACAPTPAPPKVHTIDQQYLAPADQNIAADVAACSPGYAPDSIQIAQTFTAGRAGTLDQVGLNANRIDGSVPAAAPLGITIQTVATDGTPSGTVIGSGTYNGPANVGGVLFNMPLSTPAHVVSGQMYAIVVTQAGCASPGPDNGWTFTGAKAPSDPYAGGVGWVRLVGSGGTWRTGDRTGQLLDFFFNTWVA